jgi:hypothetical protein
MRYLGQRGEALPRLVLGLTRLRSSDTMRRIRTHLQTEDSDSVTLTVVWDTNISQEIVHELGGIPVNNGALSYPVGGDRTQPLTVRLVYTNRDPNRVIQRVTEDNLQEFLDHGFIQFFLGSTGLHLHFTTKPSQPLHVYKALEIMRLLCEFDTSPIARMTPEEIDAGVERWRANPDFRITALNPDGSFLQVELAQPNAYLRDSYFLVHLRNNHQEPTLSVSFTSRDGVKWQMSLMRNGYPYLLFFLTKVLPELNA